MQNKINEKNVIFLMTIFFSCQPFVIYSMEKQIITKKEKIVYVYSHGFGETGGSHGPTYPDAPGRIDQAVFYTRPSVICLAEYLNFKVNAEGYERIHLSGRSCGAGTAIVCLLKLKKYNPAYFQGTSIQSKQDAQKIIDAINNGALELTVPFLSIKKAIVVDTSTTIGGYGFAAAAVGTAFCLTGAATLPAVGLASAVYGSYQLIQAVGSITKNLSVGSVDEYVVPAISHQHYDSTHIKPIDAVKYLKNIIKCPTLLHFCKNDGVLANPDEDTIAVYESLRMGNEENTYIILTDDDAHNYSPSNGQYKTLHNKFKAMVYGQRSDDISEYQPTVEQLRHMIFPSIWRNLSFKKKAE